MSDSEDLLAVIRTVLPPGGAIQIEHSELDDLFEAYVLTGLLLAARAEQWTVSLHDIFGAPADSALFRRSPGNIYSSSGSQNFTHFVLARAGVMPLEAHIGIKLTGKSDVEHECDVAVLPQYDADLCRRNRVHPRSTRLVFSAECKFLAGAIPLHMGRGFIGLATELTSRYGECHFVVNTSSPPVMKMLARQKRHRHAEVRPGTERFATFQSACRGILDSYVQRQR